LNRCIMPDCPTRFHSAFKCFPSNNAVFFSPETSQWHILAWCGAFLYSALLKMFPQSSDRAFRFRAASSRWPCESDPDGRKAACGRFYPDANKNISCAVFARTGFKKPLTDRAMFRITQLFQLPLNIQGFHMINSLSLENMTEPVFIRHLFFKIRNPKSDIESFFRHRADKCVGLFYGSFHILDQSVHFGFDRPQFSLQGSNGFGIEVVFQE